MDDRDTLIDLYNQVEELLDMMAVVLPYLELYDVEINEDFVKDMSDTIEEMKEYLEYIQDYHLVHKDES